MMEMKITVEVPALAHAIEMLAAAMTPALVLDNTSGVLPAPTAPVAAPAPVLPAAPAPTPVTAPAPPAEVQAVPMAAPAPAPVPTVPTAPVPGNTPAPAPAVPVTAPAYTLDQIARAGAALVDAGKMETLLGLLGKYGVAAVTQLPADQYGAFATELRGLGAQI